MRITMITQWFQPEPFFKGLPFAKALTERGHNVEVITGFPNYPHGKLYAGYERMRTRSENIDGIVVHRVPLFPSHDLSAVRRSLNYVSFATTATLLGAPRITESDVVVVYNLITLYGAAARLRRRCAAPIVYDVQDLWPESVARSGMLANRLAQATLKKVSNSVYNSVEHLVVQSPGFRQDMIRRGVPAGRVSVIYNWANEEEALSSSHARSGVIPRDECFNVVFAGTIGRMQMLDTVLRAAVMLSDRCPDIRFTMIGSGAESENIRNSARRMNLGNVAFVDHQPPHVISKVYHEADALLVHLRKDPLFDITIPSKTQAYLAAGRPILMGVQGDAARLVEQANAGIVFAPEDPYAMADAIMRLRLERVEVREDMGRNGRAFYDAHLSKRVGVEAFDSVLESVRRRGPSSVMPRKTP